MPVIKSAKKKLRKDKIRKTRNSVLKLSLSKAIKEAVKKPSVEKITTAVKIIDKAAKNRIIHKNKAGRIKSRLSKLIKPTVKKEVKGKPKIKTSKAK